MFQSFHGWNYQVPGMRYKSKEGNCTGYTSAVDNGIEADAQINYSALQGIVPYLIVCLLFIERILKTSKLV